MCELGRERESGFETHWIWGNGTEPPPGISRGAAKDSSQTTIMGREAILRLHFKTISVSLDCVKYQLLAENRSEGGGEKSGISVCKIQVRRDARTECSLRVTRHARPLI